MPLVLLFGVAGILVCLQVEQQGFQIVVLLYVGCSFGSVPLVFPSPVGRLGVEGALLEHPVLVLHGSVAVDFY